MTNKLSPPLLAPLALGRRLLLVPLAADSVEPADKLLVRLTPSPIFGSGTHPTTQLCLLALERHMPPGATVVDLGTGSGVLAIAAARLGARAVLALDIDPAAVAVAHTNVLANGVQEQVRLQSGSLPEILVDQAEGGPADVVVVNILAHILEDLFRNGLANTVKPGGWLILSGLLPAQTAPIRACLQWYGLKLRAQEQRAEWVCLLAERLPPEAGQA